MSRNNHPKMKMPSRYFPFYLAVIFLSTTTASNNFTLTDDPTEGNCEKLLESYADKSATFMYCAILNARPFTFCESCVDGYLDVLSADQEIYVMHDNTTGESCKDKLLNRDRVEILEETFRSLEKLWTRSNCNHCFQLAPNRTLTSNLRNSTLEFNRRQLMVKECVEEYMHNSSVCDICRHPYHNLNSYYNEIKMNAEEAESGNVCMDIVDLMNATRTMWSHQLLCLPQRKSQVPLLVLSSLIMSLPLWLYGLAICLHKFSRSSNVVQD